MEGLKFYWGLGPQFRATPYTAQMRRDIAPNAVETKTGVDVDLGLDAVVGAQYKFKKLPLAVYADIVPFVEFVDFLYFHPMGGIGARYVF
jgi:hypothetical protein